VIKYTMKGVPGHSAVNGKVEYKALHRSKAFRKIQLAGAESRQQQAAKGRRTT
jgi:hypothetical protein